MNLILTINPTRPGVYNTDDLTGLNGLVIEAKALNDRAVFDTLKHGIPVGLSLHPYTGGIDVRRFGRTVGNLAVTAPRVPTQRPPADDTDLHMAQAVAVGNGGTLTFLGVGRRTH